MRLLGVALVVLNYGHFCQGQVLPLVSQTVNRQIVCNDNYGSTTTLTVQDVATYAPASLIVSTVVSTPPPVTLRVTETQAASSYTLTRTVTSLVPGSSFISTQLFTTTLRDGNTVTSTQQVTTTLPASTVTSLQIYTTTAVAPPATVSTQYATRTIISTQPAQIITSILPGSTATSTQISTLPASTRTVSYVTTFRETNTIYITSSAAGQTVTQVITSLLPASVSTVLSVTTVPASTVTYYVTRTDASVTVISTREATVISTVQVVSTQLQPTTVVSTSLSIRPTTVVSTRDVPTTREITTTASGTTIYVVSTTTSVVPASTLTQTYRTTLPGSTFVVTSSAPGQTVTTTQGAITVITTRPASTILSTTTQPGTTITTTSLFVLPASTTTLTTSVVSYINSAQVSCPANSGQAYVGTDGSRYMILCGQDYSGTLGNNADGAGGASADIYGINPVQASDLTSCIYACTNQGTVCAGVSWQDQAKQCNLKRTMFPTDPSAAVSGFDSVVRISARTSPPVAVVQQFQNGNFSSGALAPWTQFTDSASVAVLNHAAVVSYTADSGYINLGQTLLYPQSALLGYEYSLSLSIGTSGLSQNGALVYLSTDTTNDGGNPFGPLTYFSNQSPTKVYLSGQLSANILSFILFASSDAGSTITLDDISFSTYEQVYGINAIPIPPVVDNATYRYVSTATEQFTIPALGYRQRFELAAAVLIALPDASTSCFLNINFFPAQQLVVSQTFVKNGTSYISGSGVLQGSTTESYDLEFYCTGTTGTVLTLTAFSLRAV